MYVLSWEFKCGRSICDGCLSDYFGILDFRRPKTAVTLGVCRICIFFFFCGTTAQIGPRPRLFKVSRSRTIIHTHSARLLWTSDQLVAGAAAYTTHNTHQAQETNVLLLSGIRTRYPSNQTAAELNFRTHGHRNRQRLLVTSEIFMVWGLTDKTVV
jgi:hypothetical protein